MQTADYRLADLQTCRLADCRLADCRLADCRLQIYTPQTEYFWIVVTSTGHVGVKHEKTLPLAAGRNGDIGKKFGFSFLFNVPLMTNSPFLHISKEKNNCVSIYTQEFGPLIQCLFAFV